MSSVREDSVLHLPPFHYIHVTDNTSNVTRVVAGPATFTARRDESVVLGPVHMVVVPSTHYCLIQNPVILNNEGEAVLDQNGQAKLRHGESEYRFRREPFPLYPGELLVGGEVRCLRVLTATEALKLKAVNDFQGAGGVKRLAGDEFLYRGPGTYIPQVEEEVIGFQNAITIGPNQALRLKAKRDILDSAGKKRVAGEEWLIKDEGSYMMMPYEEEVKMCQAEVLTERKALIVRALCSFTDQFGTWRKAGEEYLITLKETDSFIPEIEEQIVRRERMIVLSKREYCIVENPMAESGKNNLGAKKLIRGETGFFLQPLERIIGGIKRVIILGINEGLLVKAKKDFMDENDIKRLPGDRWMIRGPSEYVPPVEVEIIVKRKAIVLKENEGIYVRNVKSGEVSAVMGQTYLLGEEEELWRKEVTPSLNKLLGRHERVRRGDKVKDILDDVGDRLRSKRARTRTRSSSINRYYERRYEYYRSRSGTPIDCFRNRSRSGSPMGRCSRSRSNSRKPIRHFEKKDLKVLFL